MKTSIATVCLSGGLNEKLQSIAAAGFRGVEIFESDLLSYNGTPAGVAKEMSNLGLRAITFQPFRDFEGMPEPQRQRTFDRRTKFDLMQELSRDSLLVCNVSPDSLGGIVAARRIFMSSAAAVARLARWLRGAGVGRHVNDYRDAWEWFAARTIPPLVSSSTPFTPSPARPISRRCAPFPATGFFSSSLPTHHGSRWMC
jgi:4-hydroxyphenylpyruvate dioxygenase